jgi:hypothetical protein
MKILSDMKRKIILVIACHFMHMISAGMTLSFGVLYREMRLDLGTGHYEAAWIASIFNGLLGLIGNLYKILYVWQCVHTLSLIKMLERYGCSLYRSSIFTDDSLIDLLFFETNDSDLTFPRLNVSNEQQNCFLTKKKPLSGQKQFKIIILRNTH